MAVIREDVVSIGFEVEKNPFAKLTSGINEIKAKLGILDETSSRLKDVDRSATVAGDTLSDMGKGLHALPGLDETTAKTKKVGEEAKKAEVTFTGLISEMGKAGKAKLDTGIKKLASAVKKPLEGMKGLAKSSQETAAYVKKVGLPHALNVGLGKAATSAKDLAGKLKGAAGVAFRETVGGLKGLASEAGKAAKSLGGKAWSGVKALGKGAAAGIAAAGSALAVGAVAAFKFGSAYETSLAKVSTIANTASVSMEDLSSDVLQLSNATGEDAAGLNEAVYQALSAGADTAGVVDLVGTAVKAAKGGYTDTTTAIDGLTSTLNAYGMATSDAEGLANQFLITQNKGKTTFGELAGSIGTVAPTANAAGVGVDQLLASVASLTANGIGTSEAMTGMKAALSNVIKPSGEAMKMAESLGLEFNTAALQSKGLVGFLDDVKTATGGDAEKMAKLFGSVEALNTVLTLTSDQGAQLMNDTMSEMATNTGALDAAYLTMSDTAENSVKKGINSFKNLGIGIYQANEGPVAELTGLFASAGQELYDAFSSGGMDGLTGQIGQTLSKVLVTITGYLPQLIQSGTQVIGSLIDGIIQNKDQIAGSVVSGLTNLLLGIIQMAPKLLMAGVVLLGSMLSGLDSQMPNIMSAGLGAIQNLCSGLLANAPAIIQSGIHLIGQLLNGLIEAAPTILTTGIQLVIMLVKGLIGAIPDLIAGAFKLIGAIWDTIKSIDWLQLGIDLVKGIGSGVVNGIKGLFGKGKDSGKEVSDGVVTGLEESLGAVETASSFLGSAAGSGLQPDTGLLSSFGAQSASAYGSGIQTGAFAAVNAADDVSGQVTSQFGVMDLTQSGLESTLSFSQGMLEGSGQLTGTAAEISAIAAEAANTDLDISVNADSSGIELFQSQVQQLSTESETSLTSLPPVFEQAFSTSGTAAAEQMKEMRTVVKSGCSAIVADTGSSMKQLQTQVSSVNLYSSGANIMSGLNRGMLSKKAELFATASSIAGGISDTINQRLQIHSPSRITEESGEFTGLGMVKGLQNVAGKITKTARAIGGMTAQEIRPAHSRYSPESSSSIMNSRTNQSQVNQYSPVFNLTLNGASASDSNERKVKRWMREAMEEAVRAMGRTNPRLREV